MDSANSSYKSNNSRIGEVLDIGIHQKLRRLRNEENFLLKSLGYSSEDFNNKVGEGENIDYLSSKALTDMLRTFYIEIRDIFDEIKDNTIVQDIQAVDIEEVKKDVMNIESKIKNMNIYLQSQLKKTKNTEEKLLKNINDKSNEIIKLKKHSKIRATPIKHLVPSPVKALINSPMKCPEVQQLQEYLANSKNRYGGWIPYSHNIFEKVWHKYFCTQENIEDFEYQEVNVENSESFGLFVNEVFQKIPGITVDEIITHNKWYTKYIFLKERQQRALEKWKTNKRIMTKLRSKMLTPTSECKKPERLCRLQKENVNEMIHTGLVSNEFKELRNILTEELMCEPLPSRQEDLVTVASTSNESGTESEIIPNLEKLRVSEHINKSVQSHRSPLSYRKATKQWNNRCVEERRVCVTNMDLKLVNKRRIPDWRLLMHDSE